ncbi:HAMP domain-containing histidine kinase [Planktothricoides sp. FACHB-1370]|uniref:histidine kinase n=3 Tax=Oscillatoriaceae TaxID=1892254 RepID=A0AAU8JCS1_9CYAN|nr:ATP-binding protein [Planktothricoides raciborskii]MBD2544851.1 HAMP domain-containing histidine kinase [Planktothricoides raciborskii FACHB-1370]MBD2583053.1 HAMP domain-containing histidine kinase [Planktothricoides raciborskii FACHB-1261]
MERSCLDELSEVLTGENRAVLEKVIKLVEDLEQSKAALMQKCQQNESELERLKSNMLQMEKMAMLGQMVSGIAHEINNPINFIYGNLPYVEEHVGDLFEVLETYEEAYPDKVEDVENILEDIDLEYIQEDLPRIVKSLKTGSERIRDLVINLRNFYRRDEATMKPGNLHEGIESTLVLLNNRYKQDIEVIKDFGKIPEVECHINQMNQVFMNLISNAIDCLLAQKEAEKEAESESEAKEVIKPSGKKRKIAIATKCLNSNRVAISITDNGPGMPDEIKNRVFEPFFTTKAIGVGTGLGLSISREIVEKTHHGSLSCVSTFGEGSTFTIELPIAQPK